MLWQLLLVADKKSRLIGDRRFVDHHLHEIGEDSQAHGVALFRVRLDSPSIPMAHDTRVVDALVSCSQHSIFVIRVAVVAVGKVGIGAIRHAVKQ